MFLLFVAVSIFLTTFFIVNTLSKEEKMEGSKENNRKDDRKRVSTSKRESVVSMLPLTMPTRERVRTCNEGIGRGCSSNRRVSRTNASPTKFR